MFCRYIYCEKANVTDATALALLYAAKKYLLTGLVAECVTVLEKELSVDMVCGVLQQSMSLGEIKLKEKSLKFISKNVRQVFSTEGFVHLSRDALEEIVSLDLLAGSNERQVYDNCMKWARHQLHESGNENPSDEEIRDKLGNVLYRIRFPTMTQKDFAELTAQSTILTLQERHDVYVYMTLGNQLETFKFATQSRRLDENVISRFKRIRGEWNHKGGTDAVSIQTTVDVVLTGIGLYGGIQVSTHDVTLEVLEGNDVFSMKKMIKMETKMTSDGSQNPIKIEFENPVYIHANTRYTVAAVIKGPKTWSGELSRTAFDFPESGSIAFYVCKMSDNGTDVSHGQFPQFFYYMVQQ